MKIVKIWDDELHRRIKRMAIDLRVSLTDCIKRALEEFLERNEGKIDVVSEVNNNKE
jgi:predicted transcriptional regulator